MTNLTQTQKERMTLASKSGKETGFVFMRPILEASVVHYIGNVDPDDNNWGWKDERLWVKSGFRGKFEVVLALTPEHCDFENVKRNHKKCVLTKQTTDLASINRGRNSKSFTNRIIEVRLKKNYSAKDIPSPKQGKHYGVTGSVLWVDNGFRGIFEILF